MPALKTAALYQAKNAKEREQANSMDKRQKKQVRFSAVYMIVGLLAMWLFQSLIFRPLVIQQTRCSEDYSLDKISKRTRENYESNALTPQAYPISSS